MVAVVGEEAEAVEVGQMVAMEDHLIRLFYPLFLNSNRDK